MYEALLALMEFRTSDSRVSQLSDLKIRGQVEGWEALSPAGGNTFREAQ